MNSAAPSSVAKSATVFEVYAGTRQGMGTSSYEILLVRGDGLLYYETGYYSHFQKESRVRMRQGQITPEQIMKLRQLIERCPPEVNGKFGGNHPPGTRAYAIVFSPTQKVWLYQMEDKRITANFDPFTGNLSAISDIPDTAKELWTEIVLLFQAAIPTDIHPDLWPDAGTDPDERTHAVKLNPRKIL